MQVLWTTGRNSIIVSARSAMENQGKVNKLTEKKKVGPGVRDVTKRRSEEWLTKWIKDPQATREENDAETRKLRKWKKGLEKSKKTKMKIKKKLTVQEVTDLIAFLKKNDGG